MIDKVKTADEVWIAVALLHRSNPECTDFSISEIIAQAESAYVTGVKSLRPKVKAYAQLHCVANRPPSPACYRMLFETESGRRRLYQPDDPCHPLRTAGKDKPEQHQIPDCYRELIDWYIEEYAGQSSGKSNDPILSLLGLGKELWADEDADTYVRRQRTGW